MNQNIQNRKKLLECQIIERQDISDLMIKLWVTKPTDYSFKPGQYCTLGVEGIERAYSIASSPDEEYMELFIELSITPFEKNYLVAPICFAGISS